MVEFLTPLHGHMATLWGWKLDQGLQTGVKEKSSILYLPVSREGGITSWPLETTMEITCY